MAKKTTAAAEKTAETKKTAAKTTTAKKTAAPAAKKTAAVKENVKIQFDGCEFCVAEIVEKAKADYKANNKAAVKSLDVYVKPEERKAYYVVNGKTEGSVDL